MKYLFVNNFTNQKIFISKLLWLVLLTIEILLIGYYLFWIRSFHYDEFESIHSGWKILNGEKIYLDFEQIHHPLLYYLLALIIKIFGSTISAVFVSRFVICIFAVGIIYYVFCLAKNIFNYNTAVISTIILPLIPWFTLSAFEIRPDVPMLFFSIVSIYYLYKYFENNQIRLLIISAIYLGISYLFLQKAVFFIVFTISILLLRLLKKEIQVKDLFIYSLILISIYSIFLVCISLETSLSSYFFFCYEYVLARGNHLGGDNNFKLIIDEILQIDRFAWIFIPAFITILMTCRLNKQQWEIVFGTLWLSLLVFLAIVPYDQYFMPATILLVIVISYGFVNFGTRIPSRIMLAVLFGVVILGSLNYYRIKSKGAQNLNEQIARVEYALLHTNENDYVYDGCNMFNLFRKDLDFFWFWGHDKIPSYATYALIKPYNYNIYQLIKEKKPKIISPCFIDLTKDDWVLNNYHQSFDNNYFYLKHNNITGFNYWHTFMDDLDIGSKIIPVWDFFTLVGNIEVKMTKTSDLLASQIYKNSFPYVGIAMEFNYPPYPVDLSDNEGMLLTYKLTGPISVFLTQEDIPLGSEYRTKLPPSENYTKLYLNWNNFQQPEWVNKPKPLNLAKITGIKFQITTPEQNSASLGIGNIMFTKPDN